MDTIRESTIEQFKVVSPRLDPIRQIRAARQYDCAVLVDEPIQTLIARAQRLTLEEMQDLAIEDLYTIVEGREIRAANLRCKACSPNNCTCSGLQRRR